MTTYYAGTTIDGRRIVRSSTRPRYTHGVVSAKPGLFWISACGSLDLALGRLYEHRRNDRDDPGEIIDLHEITAAEYRACKAAQRRR